MTGFLNKTAQRFYAETYDSVMNDWPGELDFYLALTEKYLSPDQTLLELASGTGRIAIKLAESGNKVIGLDNSSFMLQVSAGKSKHLKNILWIEGDMRHFELNRKVELVLIPAHSFQNLTTTADHVFALKTIYRHLNPGGRLVIHVDHLDAEWLAELVVKGKQFYDGDSFTHPGTGLEVRSRDTWSYDPFTQTASSEKFWEMIDKKGEISESIKSGELDFHCFFPAEMEHLIYRCGFDVEALYGDFSGNKLRPESTEMIWVIIKRNGDPV